jgi:hypothetical protein
VQLSVKEAAVVIQHLRKMFLLVTTKSLPVRKKL